MSRLRLLSGSSIVAASLGAPAVGAAAAAPAAAPNAAAAVTPVLSTGFFVIGYGLAIAGLIVGAIVAVVTKPTQFTPLDGFSALALFYIVAQALERFVEPITSILKAPAPTGGAGMGAAPNASKGEAKNKVAEYLALAYRATDEAAKNSNLELAARWQAVVEAIRKQAAVLLFGVTTAIGAVLAGALGLYLMRAVGATSVPIFLDVIVTGLVISGGSKGLHDLIKNIEKAKEEKEDPPEASK